VPRADVARLLRRHHVRVIGAYPQTLSVSLPPTSLWQGGRWRLTEHNVSGYQTTVDFYAPARRDRARLVTALASFAAELPASGVEYIDRDQMLRDFFTHPAG
jgi:hypothetical protein